MMEQEEILVRLEVIRRLVSEILQSDLRTGVNWLTHLRYCGGNLDIALKFLNEDIKKSNKKEIKDLKENGNNIIKPSES